MIYFDHVATTPINPEILKSYFELLSKYFANSSSQHLLGARVDSLQTRARQQIADLLGIKAEEIIFTSGSTEANNTAIKGVGFKYQNRGKHIITTANEHPSILKVCEQLEKVFGFEITYLKGNSDGKIELDELKQVIRKDTILVSIMQVNNETGSINDVEGIGTYLKENHPHVFFHVDAAQGIGKIPLNLENIDLLSMSAHKLNGLKGSGMLIKKNRVQIEPLLAGGNQENGNRAGTSNWPINVMLAKTLRLAYESREDHYAIVKRYNDQIREGLKDIDGVFINSPLDASPYILNISFNGHQAEVISNYLEENDICVSTVSACSSQKAIYSYVIYNMFNDMNRAKSSIRISLSHLNTDDEILKLITVIKKANREVKKKND